MATGLMPVVNVVAIIPKVSPTWLFAVNSVGSDLRGDLKRSIGRHAEVNAGMIYGYARVSSGGQDLTSSSPGACLRAVGADSDFDGDSEPNATQPFVVF
jgi:hypothetical protein